MGDFSCPKNLNLPHSDPWRAKEKISAFFILSVDKCVKNISQLKINR